MVYEVISIGINKSGRIKAYNLKNSNNGKTYSLDRALVITLLKGGDIIKGLKLSRDGKRLLSNKRIPRIQVIKKKDSSDANKIYIETGETLVTKCKREVSQYKARNLVREMLHYINLNSRDTACVLHGIRRTGKTVALRHLVLKLAQLGLDANKIKFIELQKEINIDVLYRVINNFEDCIIIIDDITRAKNFIDSAAYLSDTIVARNRNKVIIAGTDSFAFPIANLTSLFGRAVYCHSTILTFDEYTRIFGLQHSPELAFKNYRESGAIYDSDFRDFGSILNTLRAVVIANVKNTVRNNIDAVSKDTVYSEVLNMSDSKLVYIIYCIILSATSPKYSTKFYTMIQGIGKSKKEFLASISDISLQDLDIPNQGIKSSDIQCVLSILVELDIIKVINNLTCELFADNQFKAITDKEVCILIPGLIGTITAGLRDNLREGILNENIVLSQLCTLRDNSTNSIARVGYLKYKSQTKEHEVDAVAIVKNKNTFKRHIVLIEVKSDIKPHTKYSQHLVDRSISDNINENQLKRIVVYFGKTFKKNNVHYVNIIDFLQNTWTYLEL